MACASLYSDLDRKKQERDIISCSQYVVISIVSNLLSSLQRLFPFPSALFSRTSPRHRSQPECVFLGSSCVTARLHTMREVVLSLMGVLKIPLLSHALALNYPREEKAPFGGGGCWRKSKRVCYHSTGRPYLVAWATSRSRTAGAVSPSGAPWCLPPGRSRTALPAAARALPLRPVSPATSGSSPPRRVTSPPLARRRVTTAPTGKHGNSSSWAPPGASASTARRRAAASGPSEAVTSDLSRSPRRRDAHRISMAARTSERA